MLSQVLVLISSDNVMKNISTYEVQKEACDAKQDLVRLEFE